MLLFHLSYFWTRETLPAETSGKQEYAKIKSYGFDESVFSGKNVSPESSHFSLVIPDFLNTSVF